MSVMIRGRRCPTIGNICMDSCMIDVTDLPECRPGDRVEIFGPNLPADVRDIAARLCRAVLHDDHFKVLASLRGKAFEQIPDLVDAVVYGDYY